ncbi:MAG TPA: ACT domain-containing protein [Candidatus Acidoferrum sp.]|nr:ACT domain-containing protein [Candidatus Acidoferrum sp.]
MSTLTLQLRVKNEEGALLRVLSMTRRRRFDLLSVNADSSADGRFMDVRMTVKAERSAPAFVRQIEKLEDVTQVEVLDSAGESSAHAAG